MSIKLAILKTGESIVADVKEIISDEIIVGYLLVEPHVVQYGQVPVLLEEGTNDPLEQIQITLLPWIVLSEDKKIPIKLDSVITIVEPLKMIKKMYEEKVNGKFEDSSDDEQSSSND
jgi:hypothetical protein